MAEGEEPHCYQSPAFDVGPDLTPGRLPATARGAVGCKAFLGAIYVLAGGEESFYCEEGGEREPCSRGCGVGVLRNNGGSQGTGQRLPAYTWLTYQAWAEASLRKPSLMDPELVRIVTCPTTTYTGPHGCSPRGCRQKQLLFSPGSGGLDGQPRRATGTELG